MYVAPCHIGAKINTLRQRGITDGKCKFNSAINKLHLVDSTKEESSANFVPNHDLQTAIRVHCSFVQYKGLLADLQFPSIKP